FVEHVIPSSIFKAMADNEVLQIVVFAVFAGTAISMLEKGAPQVMQLAEQVSEIMLKITSIIMRFAPFAIFGALASTVAQQGLPILYTYAKFVGGFYASLGLLWVVLFVFGLIFAGTRIFRVFAIAREPALLAFATASSEAAYPKVLASLPQAGIARRIVSFVLPLGYAFNLDGSMMYCTFAILFIAQAYHVDFTFGQKVMMLLLLIITSKGIAGVPKASLVVIMATLAYFGLPTTWIALVMGVDHLLDMGRSATNVVGNSVAAAVVARWEGQLGEPEKADA
ncbi:MAG: dicarboxylate/amino acid:cation symporter, partial [Asticcacaulis sp.]